MAFGSHARHYWRVLRRRAHLAFSWPSARPWRRPGRQISWRARASNSVSTATMVKSCSTSSVMTTVSNTSIKLSAKEIWCVTTWKWPQAKANNFIKFTSTASVSMNQLPIWETRTLCCRVSGALSASMRTTWTSWPRTTTMAPYRTLSSSWARTGPSHSTTSGLGNKNTLRSRLSMI